MVTLVVLGTYGKNRCVNIYRPQRSWGKVMFLQACVILFTGGVSASVHAGILHPPGADIPWGADPPEQTPPGSRHPPRCRACWEIWSMCRWYASYWNAILFLCFFSWISVLLCMEKSAIHCKVTSLFIFEQDCIPVGCVLPARWPYLPACSASGVSAPRGCLLPGGVCSQGVSAPRGYLLPGEISAPLEISWNFEKFNKYHGKMTWHLEKLGGY